MLSDAEKMYIVHGVETDMRGDGRRRSDYRSMELETSIVEHAFGSARMRLANTDVLVSVKLEMDTPAPTNPSEGKLDFFVDCSANATPDFEGRGGESLATEISNSLSTAYKSAKALDLTQLCIYPGLKCWKMYIDILILECGGNLYDAVSMTVKAALFNTKIPKIQSVRIDGTNVEVQISENLSDCASFNVQNIPIMVTLCKIGEHCIVDPSAQEECCSSCSLVMSVSGNMCTSMLKLGPGSLSHTSLTKSLSVGYAVAKRINNALMEVLQEEHLCERTECLGFLR